MVISFKLLGEWINMFKEKQSSLTLILSLSFSGRITLPFAMEGSLKAFEMSLKFHEQGNCGTFLVCKLLGVSSTCETPLV